MTPMRFLRVSSALAAAALSGCTPEETVPEGPGPIVIAQLRAEAQAAICDFGVRCTSVPDVATCKKVDAPDYELLQLIADVALGSVTYDPAAGRTWVEAVRAQPCAL